LSTKYIETEQDIDINCCWTICVHMYVTVADLIYYKTSDSDSHGHR